MTVRQRYSNSLSHCFCSNYDIMSDNIIASMYGTLLVVLIVRKMIVIIAVRNYCLMALLATLILTFNQPSMWGDCVVQLMYIGDNELISIFLVF